jgi:hypothetical protein
MISEVAMLTDVGL